VFWDFAVQVQAKSSILIETDSHLDKDQLYNRIEAGMNHKVGLCVCLKKADDKIKSLTTWIDDIGHIDELIRGGVPVVTL
jgi:hypothetical protein